MIFVLLWSEYMRRNLIVSIRSQCGLKIIVFSNSAFPNRQWRWTQSCYLSFKIFEKLLWSMSGPTRKHCFQVGKRGEQNGYDERYSFSMWCSMSWPTRKLCFQVSKRGEQNSTEKYSFSMWSTMSWPTRKLYFQVSKRGEQTSPTTEKYSFSMWCWMR
jgi:hypothetical protein